MFGPEPVCSSMIVSVRRPSALPTPYASCCLRVSPSRLSLPTRRYVVPGCVAGPVAARGRVDLVDLATTRSAGPRPGTPARAPARPSASRTGTGAGRATGRTAGCATAAARPDAAGAAARCADGPAGASRRARRSGRDGCPGAVDGRQHLGRLGVARTGRGPAPGAAGRAAPGWRRPRPAGVRSRRRPCAGCRRASRSRARPRLGVASGTVCHGRDGTAAGPRTPRPPGPARRVTAVTDVTGDTGDRRSQPRLERPSTCHPSLPPGWALPHRATALRRLRAGRRAVPRPLPPRRHAAADDAGAARLRPAGRRPPRRRPDRAAGLAERASARCVAVVLLGLVWHGFVFWLAQQHRRARLHPAACCARWPSAGRCCSSTPGGSASRSSCCRSSGSRWSGSTACSASRSPARCCSPRTWSAVQQDFISAMFGDGTATGAHARPLQRAAARRRLRRRPLGPAPRQPHGGQHRRRHRQDGPVRPAAQHAELPVRQGLGHGRAVPRRLRLRRAASSTAWSPGPHDHKALFKGYANPGVEATIEGVEGITGLKINYYAMVNLQGFRSMVDAVGGVTLNVRDRIPIGGVGGPVTGYIEPGVQQAQRLRDAVVRPLARERRRLLADGPAEVRDERDAPPAQSPQTVVHELREDRQGQRGS